MTVDIRAAAEAEAARRYLHASMLKQFAEETFVAVLVWAQAQLTPTREQIVGALRAHQHHYCDECGESYGCTCGWSHPGGYTLDLREDQPAISISEHQADMLHDLEKRLLTS